MKRWRKWKPGVWSISKYKESRARGLMGTEREETTYSGLETSSEGTVESVCVLLMRVS